MSGAPETDPDLARLRPAGALVARLGGKEGRALEAQLVALADGGDCDDASYLGLAGRVIGLLAPHRGKPGVAGVLLDLHRLHPQVADLLGKHRLYDAVAELVATAPDDYADLSPALLTHLELNYHVWQARRALRAAGWPCFVDYLKSQPRLWTPAGETSLRSTVRDAIYTALSGSDAPAVLTLLERELGADPGVARMLARRRAELAR